MGTSSTPSSPSPSTSTSENATLTASNDAVATSSSSSSQASSSSVIVPRKGKDKDNNGRVAGEGGSSTSKVLPAKSWVHFVAGGVGGMCGAIATAPFDVVKTRLQSDLFQYQKLTERLAASGAGDTAREAILSEAGGGGKGKGKEVSLEGDETRRMARMKELNMVAREGKGKMGSARGALYHFVDTGRILKDMYQNEGFRSLFRGLGPTLVGVVPSRSINFFAYGNGKQIYANFLNDGKESPSIHLIAAATAGVITSTATNPIWVVKTRLQLESDRNRDENKKMKTNKNVKGKSAIPPFQPSFVSGSLDGSSNSSQSGKLSSNSPPLRLQQHQPHPPAHHPVHHAFSLSTSATSSSISSSSPSSRSIISTAPSFSSSASISTASLSSSTISKPSSVHSSFQTISHIFQKEGIKGFYKGLSASYLGVTEGTIQWTLYEEFKKRLGSNNQKQRQMKDVDYGGGKNKDEVEKEVKNQGGWNQVVAAGMAKLIATTITYPHEVVRTRLRQAPSPTTGHLKYHGLLQSFKLILKEEGISALYGGLSPHLLRVVPNAVVMFSIYEGVLSWSGAGR